jgi:hypothetical protein
MSDDDVFPIDQAEATLFDRRGATRHPCPGQSLWRLVGEDPAAVPLARIRDVSDTGIGLCVREPLPPGAVFVLIPPGQTPPLPRPLTLRVVHATPLAEGDWLVGCQFVRRLTDQDLQALLGRE